jgi:hypothetical protein
VALVEQTGLNNSRAVAIAGTVFLIANGRVLGITAGHVAKDLRVGTRENIYPAAVYRELDDTLTAFRVLRFENHATEDVALFRLPDSDFYSLYTLRRDPAGASMETMLWGYPDDIRYDRIHDDGGLVVDLVYSAGHIRRKINYELPIARVPGRSFYELSNPAGSCCSGAPVSLKTREGVWQAIGVYVGERRNETNTFSVGYATCTNVLADQWPQLFGEPDGLAALCALSARAGVNQPAG